MLLDVGSLLESRQEVPPDQVRLDGHKPEDASAFGWLIDEVEALGPAQVLKELV